RSITSPKPKVQRRNLGLWTLDVGQLRDATLAFELSTLDLGPWALDPRRWTFDILPIELQSKLHGSRVSLNIGDTPKLAAVLVNSVCRTISLGSQTPICIGECQVLVVEGVVHFPAQFEILTLRQMELLG